MATTAAAAAAVFSASVRGAEHLRGKLRCLCIYASVMDASVVGVVVAKLGRSLLYSFAGMAIKMKI